VVTGVVAAWLGALLVLGRVLAGRQEGAVTSRLATSLHASARVEATDLALIRGRLTLAGLAVHRDDDVGHLALDVPEIRCELPPLGWALVDHACRELAIRAPRLEVSSVALFQLRHPARRPIRAAHVVIDDAVLAFSPSALVPGLGRIAIRIAHAEAGATVFRTPLSWLLTLRQLDASLELPAGLAVRLTYHDGRLSASGSLFGSRPVEVPLQLPVAQTARDAHEEIRQLVRLGEGVAERLVARRARDWIESKLR